MKKILTAAMIISALFCLGAGVISKDDDKNLVQNLMPSVNGTLEATKTDMTITVTDIHAIRIQPTVAVTMKFNGTGTGWPIAANTVQEYRIKRGINTFVFSAPSSASNKVHYQY